MKKDTNISTNDLIQNKIHLMIFKTFYFSNLKIFYCFKQEVIERRDVALLQSASDSRG